MLLISLGELARIREGNLLIVASLSVLLPLSLLEMLCSFIFSVNLAKTLFLKELLLLLVMSTSHPDL